MRLSIARQAIAKQSAERGNIGDVGAPDLIGASNRQFLQQVRVNFVLWMFLAGIRGLIDRHEAHEPHQATDTMSGPHLWPWRCMCRAIH